MTNPKLSRFTIRTFISTDDRDPGAVAHVWETMTEKGKSRLRSLPATIFA